jgi:hypothetical protein
MTQDAHQQISLRVNPDARELIDEIRIEVREPSRATAKIVYDALKLLLRTLREDTEIAS